MWADYRSTALACMQAVLREAAADRPYEAELAELRLALRASTPPVRPWGRSHSRTRGADPVRAVGSDGDLAEGSRDPNVLAAFLALAEREYRDPDRGVTANFAACLGYCSADNDAVRLLASEAVEWVWDKGSDKVHYLTFLGNCLRDPSAIGTFLGRLVDELRGSKEDLRTPELKAGATVLMYRKSALSQVPTPVCDGLFREATRRFETQVLTNSIRFAGCYALQCMAFVLRRRAYDDAFLPSNSSARKHALDLLSHALTQLERRKLRTIGGMVNACQVMKTIMEYIDRRGRGRVVVIDE